MKNHANIPIFIAHKGCKNSCVFCNQRKITGTDLPAVRDIRPEINSALATIDTSKTNVEIAFFGGSFTGLEKDEMTNLLSQAYDYIKAGKVQSIRLSTRPDYINDEILEILEKYGVKHIELGIQSASDAVLCASNRGHTFEKTRIACKKIVDKNFTLCGQMMLGLPKSTMEDEIFTARKICELGAKEARIYPTVVFCDTELCNMAKEGKYSPIPTEYAVKSAAECYKVFLDNGVKVLRVGLQSSETLSDESQIYGGANHSAIGEMCIARVYYDLVIRRIEEILPQYNNQSTLLIKVPKGEISKVSGHKKENKNLILNFFMQKGLPVKQIVFSEEFSKKFQIDLSFLK